ncbi:transmembrane protein [Cystoisospora suis]|uniref:Transmembrane protein n=1 Tax=Cystoisospora suis TaxID=483139 RepID=A0A2C6KWE0_9APIC|nr:transmembrane protein [Cystoisospora suis]
MNDALEAAEKKKVASDKIADRFTFPLVIGSCVIGALVAVFALCLGLYVTCVCWGEINQGILFTGRVCTLHQRVVGPIAVTFGLFGLTSTIFILTQGFVTPCLVAATLAVLRGGGLAVSRTDTEPR